MNEKGKAAAAAVAESDLLVSARLQRPLKLSAKALRRHLLSNYLGSSKVWGSWLILHWRLFSVTLWLLYSLALPCWIFHSMSSQAVLTRRESLASVCDERSRLLQDQFNASMNHLQALAILVSTFHHSKNPSAMDQTIFARYTERTVFQRPLMSGVAYAVQVTQAERNQFEDKQAWRIEKMSSSSSSNSNKQSPLPGDADVWEATEYAPVIFAQDAYKHAISFDMLSNTAHRDNILRARESGKGVLSAPFHLLNDRLGVILTYTIYKSELPPNARPEERVQAAVGYLSGIFDIEALVDKLLHQLMGKPSIMLKLYDTTSDIPISMVGSNDEGAGDMYHVSPLSLGDPSRKHAMHCRFKHRPPWPRQAITSSIVTLVIALLIGYIMLAARKRFDKCKEDCQEMLVLKKRSEAAEMATSQYLATVSYEIRTSIHGVVGMLQMLMDTDLNTTQQDYVTTAQATGKVLACHFNEIFYQALEKGMDGHVSKPFEGELEQDEIVEQEEELNLQEKLRATEGNLEDLGMRTKFITMVNKLMSARINSLTSGTVHNLPSRIRYFIKTVVGAGLLGWLLYIIFTGTCESCDHSFLMSNNFSRPGGRMLLVSTLNGTQTKGGAQNSDMISVDLRKIQENNDSSGQKNHWSSHNSSGITGPHLSPPAHKSHQIIVAVAPWIALVSVIILVLGIIALFLLLWCKCQKRAPQNEMELLGGIGPRRFQLHELAAATSNFIEENKLGQGGFGPVYRGYLSDQDRHVAIKVLSKKRSTQEQYEQGLREFKAEVRVMTQLRHRNIVRLVGWCDSNKQLLLVYELIAQGSLDKHLYDPERILTWPQRYKIALDLGSALLYLHGDCEKCIVHGDIKPANVMLDVSHNAKLGDFGLARLVEHGEEPQTTQVLAGTPGYIDPDFIDNHWPRPESDVYSFGVVLLEIACGKRPASRQPNGASCLLACVRNLYDRGTILDAADQRLNGEFDQQQMERVLVTGLWCAHQDPIQRPSIVQAMDVLRSADAELPVLPAYPAAPDARRIRSMEEHAYGELPVADRSVHGGAPSTYFTSKDSGYLLAEE